MHFARSAFGVPDRSGEVSDPEHGFSIHEPRPVVFGQGDVFPASTGASWVE